MIIGYNTDVEHEGVVYHVQTEDKGTNTPLILSLVYVGGAILASKRSPYDDLINDGFNEAILAERLQRQHKLICAAIHAGRIEDLKRLGQAETSEPPATEEPPAEDPSEVTIEAVPPAPVPVPVAQPARPRAKVPVEDSNELDDTLRLVMLDEQEFRGGQSVTVRLQLTRGSGGWARPIPNCRLVIKTLGSTFRPVLNNTVTGRNGLAVVPLSLPAFNSGRAAILVRAEVDGDTAELRRVILPK